MKVVSVNLGSRKTILWRGKNVQTGIFKNPEDRPIFLESSDVHNDSVVDRRFHGGVDKACYLYSADYYEYWKKKYPELEWNFGMFGENITVEGLNETKLNIGAKYQVGEALVQISQPRQPCFKLGVRFNNQKVLKEFIEFGHPGTYVRVLIPGKVSTGDVISLQEETESLSVSEIFKLLYEKSRNQEMVEKALNDENLAYAAKTGITKTFH